MRNILRKERILTASLANFDKNDQKKASKSVLKYGYNIVNELNKTEKQAIKKILHVLKEYINITTSISNYINNKNDIIVKKSDHIALNITKEAYEEKLDKIHNFDLISALQKQENAYNLLTSLRKNLTIMYESVSAVNLDVTPLSKNQEELFNLSFPSYSNQKANILTI